MLKSLNMSGVGGFSRVEQRAVFSAISAEEAAFSRRVWHRFQQIKNKAALWTVTSCRLSFSQEPQTLQYFAVAFTDSLHLAKKKPQKKQK